MTRRVVVDIVGNADDFNRATKGATESAAKLGGGLKGTAIAGAALGVASAGVTAAIDLVTNAVAGSIEAAREDTQSQDILKLAYENTGRAQALSVTQIEEVISANQAKGISDSEQRAGISAFLDLTKNATEAMALNQAAVELAAAKGIDYAAAEKLVLSATAGKVAGLNKAGVAIEKGSTATEIATAINEKYGGSLDRVAKTQQGKNAIANEKMGEAMEKVGRIINDVATTVIPILVDALVFVTDNVMPPLIAAFEFIIPVVQKVFGVATKIVGAWVGAVQTYFTVVATIIRTVFNAVIDVINGVIRGINSISFTTPDWLPGEPVTFSANLGYLPRLHAGGMVPGVPGQDVLTVLQAGETVTPAGAAAGSGNTYNISITAIDPQAASTAVVRAIDEWEQANGKRFARTF